MNRSKCLLPWHAIFTFVLHQNTMSLTALQGWGVHLSETLFADEVHEQGDYLVVYFAQRDVTRLYMINHHAKKKKQYGKALHLKFWLFLSKHAFKLSNICGRFYVKRTALNFFARYQA